MTKPPYVPTWQYRLTGVVINEAIEAAWHELRPDEQALLLPLRQDLEKRCAGMGAAGGRQALALLGLFVNGKYLGDVL